MAEEFVRLCQEHNKAERLALRKANEEKMGRNMLNTMLSISIVTYSILLGYLLANFS